jgi:hypothetical protein
MSNVEDKNGDSLRNKVQSISCESVEESQKNYGKWAETYEKVILNFPVSIYQSHLPGPFR